MKKNSLLVLMGLCLISFETLCQGVPKAYDAVNYKGKVKGRLVKLILANGYIGASSLNFFMLGKTKPLVFVPDAGVANELNRLKFVAVNKNEPAYFILDNMQDAYEETPAFITGDYFLNSKKIPFKLAKVKYPKH
ncbi:hypothetical protein [Pedobacter sp. L105]|uniref:hypothetical protein n=1 Tax=Pedobacter sp. L105 TaxID=1641871 RepID=UPI00131B4815|nr:hypothetical protein [Pedobacter sp. L105]